MEGVPLLVLLCGLPGSGKTTFCETLRKELKSSNYKPLVSTISFDDVEVGLRHKGGKEDFCAPVWKDVRKLSFQHISLQARKIVKTRVSEFLASSIDQYAHHRTALISKF